MILYNVTVKVEHGTHDDWLGWMKDLHIPDVMATGLFLEYRMSRLLGMDETDGITYSIQYLLANMEDYQEYHAEHAARLQADHQERYKGRYVAFRTMMQVVSHGN